MCYLLVKVVEDPVANSEYDKLNLYANRVNFSSRHSFAPAAPLRAQSIEIRA